MINTEDTFYGQQGGEKILYVTRPHPIASAVNMVKVYIIALILFIIFYSLTKEFSGMSTGLYLISIVIPLVVIFLGSKMVKNYQEKNISYITDRRIVRFDPTTFFATNIRTLSWDEAVKVKTFSPNMLWKQLKIGTVILHARTTVKTVDEEVRHTLSADDIELNDIYLYRDLGNYIDKILFTYKQMPKEVADIRPFIEKPKGQRY
ncbi:MAG: hypothetical protein QY322_03325 [bacterium]|nr:MAG: hypothetical protein QY322_03325 [bacterium]